MLLETVRGCRFRCKYCYYPEEPSTACAFSRPSRSSPIWSMPSSGSEGSGSVGPDAQPAARFRRFPSAAPPRQRAGAAEVFGRIAGRRNRPPRCPATPPGQLPRRRDRAAIGRAEGLGADGPADGPGGFRRGVRALLDEGIKVCVDLMLGLPGETADSARRGIDFLLDGDCTRRCRCSIYRSCPARLFAGEAKQLGLRTSPGRRITWSRHPRLLRPTSAGCWRRPRRLWAWSSIGCRHPGWTFPLPSWAERDPGDRARR